ncbi:MAG TPA: TrmH family RNA methyltransferase, partial [Ktedonobacteraceae bacterium]
VREHCDLLIKLPMHGHISSLNAAVAGSIALYEALRQRSHESSMQGKV